MRHGTQGRRSRNRGHNMQQSGQRRGPIQNRNHIFDSNGPDVRIRGTAHQVCEKYLVLAKDAASAGDSILAESYLQHAEHYQRIVNSWNDEFQAQNRMPVAQPYSEDNQDSDLSLPVSVLGGPVKVSDQPSQAENVQSQPSFEDA